MMSKIAICTVISKNYLCYARNLFRSLNSVHNDIEYFALISDEINSHFDKDVEDFNALESKDLLGDKYKQTAFKYNILEYNTCLKPILVSELFNRGFSKVIYLDADIHVFSPMTKLIDMLDNYSVVLTPHITEPLPQNYNDSFSELQLLKNGALNTGCMGFSNTPECISFLEWFTDKCLNECYNEPENGLFVDQKWLDMATSLVGNLYVLRDKNYNMAYWNLHERSLNGLKVNDASKLVFFHFSGLDLYDLNGISKHQGKYSLEARDDLSHIFTIYKESVLNCGYENTIKWPYTYSKYDNGEPIGDLSRLLYAKVMGKYSDPFEVDVNSYYFELKKNGLLESVIKRSNTREKESHSSKIRIMNKLLKIMNRILGVDRYKDIMRYFKYISVLRRQGFLLDNKKVD